MAFVDNNCDQHVASSRLRVVPSCARSPRNPFVTTWESHGSTDHPKLSESRVLHRNMATCEGSCHCMGQPVSCARCSVSSAPLGCCFFALSGLHPAHLCGASSHPYNIIILVRVSIIIVDKSFSPVRNVFTLSHRATVWGRLTKLCSVHRSQLALCRPCAPS